MVKNTKEYHLVLTVGSARWRIVDRSGGAGPEKDSSVAWHFVDNKTKRETVFFWYRGDPYVLSGTVLRHTLAMQFIPFVILGRLISQQQHCIYAHVLLSPATKTDKLSHSMRPKG